MLQPVIIVGVREREKGYLSKLLFCVRNCTIAGATQWVVLSCRTSRHDIIDLNKAKLHLSWKIWSEMLNYTNRINAFKENCFLKNHEKGVTGKVYCFQEMNSRFYRVQSVCNISTVAKWLGCGFDDTTSRMTHKKIQQYNTVLTSFACKRWLSSTLTGGGPSVGQ